MEAKEASEVLDDLWDKEETLLVEEKEEAPSPPQEEGEETSVQNEENEEEGETKPGDQAPAEEKPDVPDYLKALRLEKNPETPEEMLEVLKRAGKIINDTRSAQNKDHMAYLEEQKKSSSTQEELAKLKKELDEARKKQSEFDLKEQNLNNDQFKEKFAKALEEDPEKAYVDMLLEMRKELLDFKTKAPTREEAAKLAYEQYLNAQEEECRAKHEDYDEVLEPFKEAMARDSKTRDRWMKAGGTAEKAYELAKEYQEIHEFSKDPKGYRLKILEEIKKEHSIPEKRTEPKKTTLSSLNSSKAPSYEESKHKIETDDDVLTDLWG